MEQLKRNHEVDADNQNGWFLSCRVRVYIFFKKVRKVIEKKTLAWT